MKRLVAASILAVTVGCTSPTAPDDAAWSPAYDAAWQDVVACWGAEPAKPRVVVREDCTVLPGETLAVFNLNTGSSLPTVWVYGDYASNVAQVCPDLAALRHELSHHVSLAARGTSGYNGEGKCWL